MLYAVVVSDEAGKRRAMPFVIGVRTELQSDVEDVMNVMDMGRSYYLQKDLAGDVLQAMPLLITEPLRRTVESALDGGRAERNLRLDSKTARRALAVSQAREAGVLTRGFVNIDYDEGDQKSYRAVELDDAMQYRCQWNHSIHPLQRHVRLCPNCNRNISSEVKAVLETRVMRQVLLAGERQWTTLELKDTKNGDQQES